MIELTIHAMTSAAVPVSTAARRRMILLPAVAFLIALWAQQNGLYLDLLFGGVGAPTYFVALIAGLVSFLSPCVLPLVPAYVGYLSAHAAREVR